MCISDLFDNLKVRANLHIPYWCIFIGRYGIFWWRAALSKFCLARHRCLSLKSTELYFVIICIRVSWTVRLTMVTWWSSIIKWGRKFTILSVILLIRFLVRILLQLLLHTSHIKTTLPKLQLSARLDHSAPSLRWWTSETLLHRHSQPVRLLANISERSSLSGLYGGFSVKVLHLANSFAVHDLSVLAIVVVWSRSCSTLLVIWGIIYRTYLFLHNLDIWVIQLNLFIFETPLPLLLCLSLGCFLLIHGCDYVSLFHGGGLLICSCLLLLFSCTHWRAWSTSVSIAAIVLISLLLLSSLIRWVRGRFFHQILCNGKLSIP